MTTDQLARRKERSETEPLIIARTEDGFRVHTPGSPAKVYVVSGSPDDPTCTCPDFRYHDSDPDWRCKHILAVEARFDTRPSDEEADPVAAEERRAIQEEGQKASPGRRPRTPKAGNGAAQMLLKRSVSPDGRIDSLSVEFTTPVEKLTVAEIKDRAGRILTLQDEIASGFTEARNGKDTGEPPARETADNGPVPATMLDIGGMNGKWGRRLFLTFKVNGETLKLFGNRKQLAEAIEAAGYDDYGEVEEGVKLDLPCRVTTKPTPDGRYTNIEQVYPAPRPPQRRTR